MQDHPIDTPSPEDADLSAAFPPESPFVWSSPSASPPGPRGFAGLAWAVIICVVLAQLLLMAFLAEELEVGADDPVGEMLMQIEGRYLVGAAELMGSGPLLYEQAQGFNVGSVGQRLQFVVLAAELSGPAEARLRLDELEGLIAQQRRAAAENDEEPLELTEDQAAALRILPELYLPLIDDGADAAGEEPPAVDPTVLAAADRDRLVEAMGWFGELAVAPSQGDQDLRDAALAPAVRTFLIIFGVFIAGGIVGFGGFIGLIIMIVLACLRRLRSGVAPGRSHHGIYAETFALWLGGFLLLQLGADVVARFLPLPPLLLAFLASVLSLLVLAWPVLRGIPWHQVRQDIGWTLGRSARGGLVEPFFGLLSYAMTLPLLALGVLLTFLLIVIDGVLRGPAPPLAPAGGPAHPIIVQLGSGDLMLILQVLLIGVIAAPILEETMFRGVLYRHLRDASAALGFATSVILSVVINAFVFAIIHPQGWVAVPALMSLAIGFTLAREWRGTLIPSIVMHGLSNGLVLSLVSVLAAP